MVRVAALVAGVLPPGGDEPGDVTQGFTRRDPSLGDGRQDKRVVVQHAKRIRDERGHGIAHDSHDV